MERKRATNSGVISTPARFESVALNTAAATFPRATAVSEIEDETVEGTTER